MSLKKGGATDVTYLDPNRAFDTGPTASLLPAPGNPTSGMH